MTMTIPVVTSRLSALCSRFASHLPLAFVSERRGENVRVHRRTLGLVERLHEAHDLVVLRTEIERIILTHRGDEMELVGKVREGLLTAIAARRAQSSSRVFSIALRFSSWLFASTPDRGAEPPTWTPLLIC
jgi:hypothetical protein